MKRILLIAAIAACTTAGANAQTNPLTLSAYVEGYYTYDLLNQKIIYDQHLRITTTGLMR